MQCEERASRSAARGVAKTRRGRPPLVARRPRPQCRAVHVDHDHEPGKVPGVPGFNCNSAFGKLKDGPGVLRRDIAYLEGNVWKPILEAPGVYQLPS
ncbi:endonuclease domain-containing protein [Streptomyces sp. NPDC050315]|uniref:endonuclease domain-containing protein n=1 Tax=Streptomyces sp. NPDC050315 TaxID=3155039 RepID=UPI00341D621E